MVKRTSLKLPQDRQDLIGEASRILSTGPEDDPPMADVFDASMTHLIESKENLVEVKGVYPATTIKDIANTSVLRLHYESWIEAPWRG